jgi:flagellar assembly protein FliH
MADRSRKSRIIEDLQDLRRAFLQASGHDDPDGGIDPVEEAYRNGFREGLHEGRERALVETEEETENQRAELREALKHLAALEEMLTLEHEARLLEVTLEAASRIVRARIDDGDPVALRALREAMESLPESTRMKVRLHPEDLEGAAATLTHEVENGRLRLEADRSLSRGGCVVETPAGTVDATLETAEEVVRDAANGRAEAS